MPLFSSVVECELWPPYKIRDKIFNNCDFKKNFTCTKIPEKSECTSLCPCLLCRLPCKMKLLSQKQLYRSFVISSRMSKTTRLHICMIKAWSDIFALFSRNENPPVVSDEVSDENFFSDYCCHPIRQRDDREPVAFLGNVAVRKCGLTLYSRRRSFIRNNGRQWQWGYNWFGSSIHGRHGSWRYRGAELSTTVELECRSVWLFCQNFSFTIF